MMNIAQICIRRPKCSKSAQFSKLSFSFFPVFRTSMSRPIFLCSLSSTESFVESCCQNKKEIAILCLMLYLCYLLKFHELKKTGKLWLLYEVGCHENLNILIVKGSDFLKSIYIRYVTFKCFKAILNPFKPKSARKAP